MNSKDMQGSSTSKLSCLSRKLNLINQSVFIAYVLSIWICQIICMINQLEHVTISVLRNHNMQYQIFLSKREMFASIFVFILRKSHQKLTPFIFITFTEFQNKMSNEFMKLDNFHLITKNLSIPEIIRHFQRKNWFKISHKKRISS